MNVRLTEEVPSWAVTVNVAASPALACVVSMSSTPLGFAEDSDAVKVGTGVGVGTLVLKPLGLSVVELLSRVFAGVSFVGFGTNWPKMVYP